jgi:ribonucleoside-triphosphate reductase
MADEDNKITTEQPSNGEQPDGENDEQDQSATPSEAQNTEHMIPKSRFDEVNEAKKAEAERATKLENELKEYREAQDKAEQEALEEKGEFEELYTAEKTKAADLQAQLTVATDTLTAYKAAFLATQEKRMANVPEHIKPLLEKMDALEVSAYLDANEDQFTAPDGKPRKQDAPPMHGSEGVQSGKGERTVTLTRSVRL